jgi:hypothetical protein
MTASNTSLAVPLDPKARQRISAAGLLNLPAGVFLAESADERARSILRDWAVARYRRASARSRSLRGNGTGC